MKKLGKILSKEDGAYEPMPSNSKGYFKPYKGANLGEPHKVSASGSQYWFFENGFVRYADHWGLVASQVWKTNLHLSKKCKNPNKEAGYFYITYKDLDLEYSELKVLESKEKIAATYRRITPLKEIWQLIKTNFVANFLWYYERLEMSNNANVKVEHYQVYDVNDKEEIEIKSTLYGDINEIKIPFVSQKILVLSKDTSKVQSLINKFYKLKKVEHFVVEYNKELEKQKSL
jgi:hypothetical protein